MDNKIIEGFKRDFLAIKLSGLTFEKFIDFVKKGLIDLHQERKESITYHFIPVENMGFVGLSLCNKKKLIQKFKKKYSKRQKNLSNFFAFLVKDSGLVKY